MVNDHIRKIRFGTETPLPERRKLRAGAFDMLLEGGMLRYIRYGDTEVVRGIYAAVRDKDWGTVEPRFLNYEVVHDDHSFTVRFTAEHQEADVDFIWQGVMEGRADSTIRFSMSGEVRSSFLKNRIGFCVLHPIQLAGQLTAVKTEGGWREGAFPAEISPHQPFPPFSGLRYPVSGGARVEVLFEGDLFEMEDQRNWSDASYKTYCTPLHSPYPVRVSVGDKVTQSVTVRLLGGKLQEVDQQVDQFKEPGLTVRIFDEQTGTVPQLGVEWATRTQTLSPIFMERLRKLRLSHIWAELLLSAPDWREDLSRAVTVAGEIGADLIVSVLVGTDESEIDGLFRYIAFLHAPVQAVAVYPFLAMTSDSRILRRVRQACAEHGLNTLAGGGSRAYFAQFNRARLPLEDMQFAAYTINPQVHVFDIASIVETLEAQEQTVSSARRIAGALPLYVGPVTLRPRFSPDAQRPGGENQALLGACRPDPRQQSLFTAGWTVGSVHRLGGAGAAAITYYQAAGPCGLMDADGGQVYPVYHALADILEFRDGSMLRATVSDPLRAEVLAMTSRSSIRLLVSSLSDEEQTVTLELPWECSGVLHVLDETNAAFATTESDQFRNREGRRVASERSNGCDNGTNLYTLRATLLPFSVARLDLYVN